MQGEGTWLCHVHCQGSWYHLWLIHLKAFRLQVLLLETAVAGIGPFNRKWKGFEEKGEE